MLTFHRWISHTPHCPIWLLHQFVGFGMKCSRPETNILPHQTEYGQNLCMRIHGHILSSSQQRLNEYLLFYVFLLFARVTGHMLAAIGLLQGWGSARSAQDPYLEPPPGNTSGQQHFAAGVQPWSRSRADLLRIQRTISGKKFFS